MKFVAQMIENLPVIQKTWVWSLGQEDPLEKGMATHSRILAWIIPWTEEPSRLQSMELPRVTHDWSDLAHSRVGLPRCHQWQRIILSVQETPEMQVQSLGRKDPLEEGTATHSRILACKSHGPRRLAPTHKPKKGTPKVIIDWICLSVTDRTSREKNDKNTQDFNTIIYQTWSYELIKNVVPNNCRIHPFLKVYQNVTFTKIDHFQAIKQASTQSKGLKFHKVWSLTTVELS